MAVKRKNVQAFIQTPVKEREPHDPTWDPKHVPCMQHVSLSVRQIVEDYAVEGGFHVPPWQRPIVWADTQVLALLDSLMSGYSVGSLLLWERCSPEGISKFAGKETRRRGSYYIVVDGQQRLWSINEAMTSGRFGFDFSTRTFFIDDFVKASRDRIPLDWLIKGLTSHWEAVRAWIDENPSGLNKYSYLVETLTHRTVSAVRIPDRWKSDQVIESFRRINTLGTPVNIEHLRAGLTRYDEGQVE